MESFPLSLEQFRYVRKHRKNLEMRFHLKIFLPEEYNLTYTLANVTGEKRNIQELKDLLEEKVEDDIDNPSTSNDVPLIILSDSGSETQLPCETPMKKLKKLKKLKKRKFESINSSTPSAARNLAAPRHFSEVLDYKIAPASKRARSGPAFPSEDYIPLSVTKNIEGARSVKIKPKINSLKKAANKKKSNSSCVKSTSAISATSSNTCETDNTSSLDESVRIIDDTLVLGSKPSSSSTATSETDATLPPDDSVIIVDDSVQTMNDSVRIIKDCFVLDKTPSLPKDNDTTVLDDSIVEITPSTYRNSTTTNNFPFNSLANNFLSLNSVSVQLPLFGHPFQQHFVSNHNQIINGLQYVESGSLQGIVPNGLVPQVPRPTTLKLRPVVIDGSNVARAHGLSTKTYSCKGIKICVDYFLKRGHSEITAFIPLYRKHHFYGPFPTTDAHLLEELETAGKLAYSPSRRVHGKKQCCYDDRFVVDLATQNGGVIVSNDNFRDIMVEREDFKKTVTERLLMFCFAGDSIMFPDDPLGRDGPRLKEFLAFPP